VATVIAESDVFVQSLHCDTFVGVSGASLAEEVRAARASKLQLLLVHELDAVRGGCGFSTFFETTLGGLVGSCLYSSLAIPVYADPHAQLRVHLRRHTLMHMHLRRHRLSHMHL
jgi:hypothetical protein